MKKNKTYKGEVTDELRDIYKQAKEDGIWLLELGNTSYGTGRRKKIGSYLTAAGSIRQIENLEKKLGREIDISKLTLGDVVDISLPGLGKTREESCRNAIKAWKEQYTNRK